MTVLHILASATLKTYLYPAENVATGRALTGGNVVKGFSSPDIVKKDKVEVVSASPAPAALPMSGGNGRRRAARGGRRF